MARRAHFVHRGQSGLSFSPTEEAKLKQYVEDGGLIVFNADQPLAAAVKDAFPASVRLLAKGLFGREFRPLPATHPLLADTVFRPNRWPADVTIQGVSNGARELMLLLPGDAGKAWQANVLRSKSGSFELGTDIFVYAIDKRNLRYRGQTFLERPIGKASRTIRVARLLVGDNPDPEPGGWRRLDAFMRNRLSIGVETIPMRLGEGLLTRRAAATGTAGVPKTSPAPIKVAHLTGTTRFTLTAAQRNELITFVAGGGTLVVDAAGGSREFADAADAELTTLFGGTPGSFGSELPMTHELFNLPRAVIPAVAYRQFARTRLTGRLNASRLRAIEEGDRAIVIFSREDLSTGLVGEPVDGILGYDPDSATALLRNILLYATR